MEPLDPGEEIEFNEDVLKPCNNEKLEKEMGKPIQNRNQQENKLSALPPESNPTVSIESSPSSVAGSSTSTFSSFRKKTADNNSIKDRLRHMLCGSREASPSISKQPEDGQLTQEKPISPTA